MPSSDSFLQGKEKRSNKTARLKNPQNYTSGIGEGVWQAACSRNRVGVWSGNSCWGGLGWKPSPPPPSLQGRGGPRVSPRPMDPAGLPTGSPAAGCTAWRSAFQGPQGTSERQRSLGRCRRGSPDPSSLPRVSWAPRHSSRGQRRAVRWQAGTWASLERSCCSESGAARPPQSRSEDPLSSPPTLCPSHCQPRWKMWTLSVSDVQGLAVVSRLLVPRCTISLCSQVFSHQSWVQACSFLFVFCGLFYFFFNKQQWQRHYCTIPMSWRKT